MPFKDIEKRREYQRDYQKKRRHRQKALLQLERDSVIAIKEMRKVLIARTVLPIKSVDRHSLIPDEFPEIRCLPILSKGYWKLGNKEMVKKAALALAEIEDKFCLTGEHQDFPCFNIKGLALTEGRTVVTEKPSDVVEAAIKALIENGHKPPFTMILNSRLERFGVVWLNDKRFQLRYSPNIFREDGFPCDGLLVADSRRNFIAMGLDVTLSLPKKLGEENLEFVQIAEVLAPVIKDPTAICELRFNVTV